MTNTKLYDLCENRIASCVWNAWQDGKRETHCASPEDKKAAVELERRGLAKIRRTDDMCGGWKEWWVRFTPCGAIAYEGAVRTARERAQAERRAEQAVGRLLALG